MKRGSLRTAQLSIAGCAQYYGKGKAPIACVPGSTAPGLRLGAPFCRRRDGLKRPNADFKSGSVPTRDVGAYRASRLAVRFTAGP
jgi:hypothetical protein